MAVRDEMSKYSLLFTFTQATFKKILLNIILQMQILSEIYLLRENLWILSPICGHFLVGKLDETLTNMRVDGELAEGCGFSMPKGQEDGKKVLSGSKTLCIKDFFVVGWERERERRWISATCPRREKSFPKVVACIYSDHVDGTWESPWPVDGWHSYKQLLLRQR